MKDVKTLYLLRGVSGSGKTTLAKNLKDIMESGGIFAYEVSADDYFTKDGVYMFNPKLLKDAHRWCQDFTESAMRYEECDIIVHNTFTTDKELEPYLKLAEEYEYKVVSLIVENRHRNSSVHGVPEKTLERQANRLKNNIKLR